MKRLMVDMPATKPPDAPKSASTMFLAGPKARLRAKLTEKSGRVGSCERSRASVRSHVSWRTVPGVEVEAVALCSAFS